MNSILAVSEIYPAFQGEGRNAGMPCVFLRLAGCNLSCVWCDTKYTWDWAHYDPKIEIHPMTVDAVTRRLNEIIGDYPLVKNLVITGGEPMLQQRVLLELTPNLHAAGWHTEMETAGTITPRTTEIVKQFNVSPKMAHSGNPASKRINPAALRTFAISGRATFKFVAQQTADFDEIDAIVKKYDIPPALVYIMPEGTDSDTLNRRMIEMIDGAMARGYHIAQRLHVLIYGHQRGV